MTIKKTITLKGKREITLPYENYLAHEEVVDHWIDGGKVDCCGGGRGWDVINTPAFNSKYEYRIKQREPQPGEVWNITIKSHVYDEPYMVVNGVHLVSLKGDDSLIIDDDAVVCTEYLAASVQAWVAQEILKNLDPNDISDKQAYKAHNLVYELAQEPDK